MGQGAGRSKGGLAIHASGCSHAGYNAVTQHSVTENLVTENPAIEKGWPHLVVP